MTAIIKMTDKSQEWYTTPTNEPRGYIQPGKLKELWFHTGTRCNLACDFCLEGSSPSDKRLAAPKFEEAKPFIDQAISMGVEQFSFTGGEPFLVKDIIKMIDYASQHCPVLVLTNGTKPLIKRFESLRALSDNPHPISLRVSFDHLDPTAHDAHRGEGNFAKALSGLIALHQAGFHVSIARHMEKDENQAKIEQGFRQLFQLNGLPQDLHIVAFPDFLTPGSLPHVPHISEHCMTHYQNEKSRSQFMCHSSKMVIKYQGEMQVYACTLVDDDKEYGLGQDLVIAQQQRISMKHHRCYSCFAYGSSCSER
ncbi:radical SAM protein [Psychrobium sp. 1_MG-2023]|uniref:radical SAM protein n=1 Tax=Psychrobium sp. 1_MG-2023 TaxID=3062624 RepID=UPI0027364B0E|nr:radical SAM protein [Psychrobium sp. 1_MG-2023]MDP2560066.1 radical SAM protein [Psychrobium sp. 1_MG-2023]